MHETAKHSHSSWVKYKIEGVDNSQVLFANAEGDWDVTFGVRPAFPDGVQGSVDHEGG